MQPLMTERSTENTDDASCIAASLAAPHAFGTLYDRHAATVFRYVCSRLGPDADDVVGDTFVIAFRIRSKFDASRGRSALPWLLGIATKAIAKRRDAELRWIRRPAPDGPAADRTDEVESRVDGALLSPWLRASLEQLRRGDREALLLHVVGDLSVEDVGQALGIPPGTVKSRLHRARTILAAQLEIHR